MVDACAYLANRQRTQVLRSAPEANVAVRDWARRHKVTCLELNGMGLNLLQG